MRITDIKILEGCLEGEYVRDILFDGLITLELINFFGNIGKTVIHNLEPKPFFTIIARGKYTIKGSIGNNSERVIFPDKFAEIYLDEIFDMVNKFSLQST